VDPKVGVIVFAAASILKDAVNRIGDLLDDGPAQSELQGLIQAANKKAPGWFSPSGGFRFE
jgi:hypothetical protein